MVEEKKNDRRNFFSSYLVTLFWKVGLWTVTIYTGLFTIAFQRYENKVNRLYSSFSAYIERIGTDLSNSTLQGFIDLQSDQVPYEANYWNPISVFMSFTATAPFAPIVRDVGNISPGAFHKLISYDENDPFRKTIHVKNFITNGELNVDSRHFLFVNSNIASLNSFGHEIYLETVNTKIDDFSSRFSTLHLSQLNASAFSSSCNLVHFADSSYLGFSVFTYSLIDPGSVFTVKKASLSGNVIKVIDSMFSRIIISVNSIINIGNSEGVIFYKCEFTRNPIFSYTSNFKEDKTPPFVFYKCTINGLPFSNYDSASMVKTIVSKQQNMFPKFGTQTHSWDPEKDTLNEYFYLEPGFFELGGELIGLGEPDTLESSNDTLIQFNFLPN